MGSAEALGGLIQYRGNHALSIFKYVAVPEAKHRPSRLFQKSGAAGVIGLPIAMVRAVKLDRQLGCPTRNVHDIGADDKLPSKARPKLRQASPYHAFDVGLAVPQGARIGCHMSWHAAHRGKVTGRAPRAYPPPAPPFQGGEQLMRRATFQSGLRPVPLPAS